MNGFLRITIWGCLLLTGWAGFAQQSTNVVDFLLTYDATTTRYTAWVVPRYNLPNPNNSGSSEKGSTAQFTIKVPASFTITNVQDIKGDWDKRPNRLGPGTPPLDWSGSGLDPAVNYFVIGKTPSQTDYGTFASGVPVALFTFQGNGCAGPLSVLEAGNPFITEADQRFSLNVANSFYSTSGTPSGGSSGANQPPLEQFRTATGNQALCASLTANPDSKTLTAGLTTSIPVLTNDFNTGGPASTTNVTLTIATPPTTGTATVNTNGGIDFSPALGFTGPVSFTYTICDISQPTVCASAVISLTVNPAPVVLTANPDSQTLTAGLTTSIPVLTNDFNNGGPASTTNVTLTIATPPATGTATVNTNGSIDFSPALGFTGPVSFTYTICDISQPTVCASAVISLTVNPAPVVLTANPDSQTLTAGLTTSIPVLTNDFNNGGPASTTNVTLTIATPPTTGTATVNTNGSIDFSPAQGFTGPVSFTYTICDISQPTVCASAVISLTVNPAPVVLTANPDSQTLTAGLTTSIPVLTNDFNNGGPASTANVTVTIATPPATGTATVNTNGSIDFSPAQGFTGPVSFTYTICDISQPTVCASAVISLTVNPAPNQSADLLITKKVSQSGAAVGDVVSFTITVQNMGPGSAVAVTVTDTLLRNSTVQVQGTPTPSKGSFNPATGLWTVGDLTANEAVTFVLSVRLLTEGVVVNVASVTATGSQDPNETNNMASACTSVPYTLCSGESLTVSVPREYLNVQWYRDGGSTPVFTGNTVTLDLSGSYTVSASNGSCPIAGCCPIVIQAGACCPPDACVPFVIKKTKSRI